MGSLRPAPQQISVVMPVRDGAATISAQLEALADQDYPGPWELIVADDGSRDATRAIVLVHAGRQPRVRLLAAPASAPARNRASAARNLAAGLATGELLAFCDADDIVAPEWLSALAEGSRHGDIVAGALDTTALNTPLINAWQLAPGWQRFGPRFRSNVTSANCAIWADVLAALGGFDEQHPGAEDKDLAWRGQLAGYRVHQAPDAIVAYRHRTTLAATARQRYRWGASEPRLFRDFAHAGMARPGFNDALRFWAWSIASLPTLPLSAERRGRWTVRTAQRAGRAVGSARERVLFL